MIHRGGFDQNGDETKPVVCLKQECGWAGRGKWNEIAIFSLVRWRLLGWKCPDASPAELPDLFGCKRRGLEQCNSLTCPLGSAGHFTLVSRCSSSRNAFVYHCRISLGGLDCTVEGRWGMPTLDARIEKTEASCLRMLGTHLRSAVRVARRCF